MPEISPKPKTDSQRADAALSEIRLMREQLARVQKMLHDGVSTGKWGFVADAQNLLRQIVKTQEKPVVESDRAEFED